MNASSSVSSNISLKKKSNFGVENLDPTKYQLPDNRDPEYTNDFSMASLKVLNNMMKNPQAQENPELLKLLTSDNPDDFSKLEANQRERIASKIESFLEKKSRKLEVIQERVNEEFEKVYTFNPQTNNEKNIRRNFEQFINDQINHVKKTNEKIQNLKSKTEKENYVDSCPKISEKSKKIFEEKLKTDVPVYMRLYQSKVKEVKNEILKKSDTKSVSICSNIEYQNTGQK